VEPAGIVERPAEVRRIRSVPASSGVGTTWHEACTTVPGASTTARETRRQKMNVNTFVALLIVIAAAGVFVLGGDQVRGERGQGEVHQEMVDPNHAW
jgi:hypothetical protein